MLSARVHPECFIMDFTVVSCVFNFVQSLVKPILPSNPGFMKSEVLVVAILPYFSCDVVMDRWKAVIHVSHYNAMASSADLVINKEIAVGG